MLFVIGGEGGHMSAYEIQLAMQDNDVPCTVVGVPKSIENDILLIDRTFGFDTAVEEAQRALYAAKTEAFSAYRGIGIVKLMGRQSGFIAMQVSACGVGLLGWQSGFITMQVGWGGWGGVRRYAGEGSGGGVGWGGNEGKRKGGGQDVSKCTPPLTSLHISSPTTTVRSPTSFTPHPTLPTLHPPPLPTPSSIPPPHHPTPSTRLPHPSNPHPSPHPPLTHPPSPHPPTPTPRPPLPPAWWTCAWSQRSPSSWTAQMACMHISRRCWRRRVTPSFAWPRGRGRTSYPRRGTW